MFIACFNGLKGFTEAIHTVFPQAQIQLCIIHMVRNSMKYVPWKDYKAVTGELKLIYQSVTEEEAFLELDNFCSRWDNKYPKNSHFWPAHCANLNTLFKYPQDIQRPSTPPMR